jgi:NADH-quinone oxidoreductase subunit E
MAVDLARIDDIIARHGADRSALTAMLIDLEHTFSYVPPESLERIAARIGAPLMQVYQVARFYNAFHLKPRGRHVVSVCAGTACFVEGNRSLLDALRDLLRIGPGETTSDGEYTLEMVNCPGNCPAGPVITIDGRPHGRVSAAQLPALVFGREAAARA